ncbi:hypothetical protein ACFSBT_20410 [Halomarina rubra]|uniref:Uncharacterized protein n=2 Tax=Halomarina rubra TaxID=2071873 RepID=A0ABD6B1I6_9EURY
MLSKLIQFIREAGSASEASHDRDGFLSNHAETHAIGMGLSLGFAAGALNQLSLVGVVVSLAVYGRAGETNLDAKIVEDVRQEPHYALGALVVGVLLGVATRFLL